MRISTSMQYDTHMSYLQAANTRLDKASQQYNTGLKFSTAGEDPSGMAQKVKYEADVETFNQYQINAGLAADSLAQSETALEQLWTVMNSVEVRIQQAVNGTMDQNSLDAIAEDIEQAQAQIFDLMNTKNSEGEYIFSGAQSSRPTITLTSDGHYICQADGSTRSVQVSPTVTVQVTDSGLNIFQNVAKAHEITVYDQADAGGNALADSQSQIVNYDDFEDLYDSIFSSSYPATDNIINFTVNDGTFTVSHTNHQTNTTTDLGSGELNEEGQIEFKGMVIDASAQANGGTLSIVMEPVEKDNILNVLNDVISTLRDPTISNEERAEKMSQAQISVANARDSYDMYRGQIGARQANIDNIIDSDNALSIIKQTAKANISEIDTYEAASNLLKEQMALQTAQQSYSVVHGTSLFDFI